MIFYNFAKRYSVKLHQNYNVANTTKENERLNMGKLIHDGAKVIFVGGTEEMFLFIDEISSHNRSCVKALHGIFVDTELPDGFAMPLLGGIQEALPYVEAHPNITAVVCSTEDMSGEFGRLLFECCEASNIRFYALPPRLNTFDRCMRIHHEGFSFLLTPDSEPLAGLVGRVTKRLFDILLSVFLILTIVPVAVVWSAVCTKAKSSGSILVLASRAGRKGKLFHEFSFRTVHGSFLAWLPKVFNVLFGDMSFVGPRNSVRPWVRPGLTGLSQVHGYEEGSCDCQRCDMWYVEHWSLWIDLRIIFRTIF